MDTIYFVNDLCWTKETPFLETTENGLLERLENKFTTFEVLKHNDFEYKLYFDIDCKLIAKEDFTEELCNVVEEEGEGYIRECLGLLVDIEPNISIATSHTNNYLDKKTKIYGTKISVRYFISNIRANKKLQLKFVEQMNKYIASKKNEKPFIFKYIPFTDKLFDMSIYDTNRKMRCLNSSKPYENRPLVLLRGEAKDTIISGFFDENTISLPNFSSSVNIEEETDNESVLSDITLTEEEENYNDIDYLLNVCIKDKMCAEGDHKDWNTIGQALKNDLGEEAVEPFVKWTYKFGSTNKKAEAVNQITKHIKKAPMKQKDRLSIGTIHFHAKKYNLNAYNLRFNKSSVIPEQFLDIEETMFDCGDYGYAIYFCKKWGHLFKCVDIEKKLYYNFNELCLWEYSKTGQKIREIISNEMANDYKQYQNYLLEQVQKYSKYEENAEKLQRKIKKVSEVLIKLGKTNDKNNITREIQDKIFDGTFENLLNKRKYFLPIKNNKMFNMKTLEVTDRTINDLFSYECDANYVDMTEIEEKDIEQYFLDLFCGKEDTMQVVLNILKSCLTGETLRYIYFFTGSGCNGKSLLFNILNKIFNKSIDTIDTRVILESKSSNLTTEYEKLDKCRIGYVTELKETDVLNTTNIKKWTGGDPIDFRGLYQSNKTIYPTSNPFVLTNQMAKYLVEKAMMDRTVVVQFNNVFEVDITFESKMLEKRDFIFSFIMKYGVIQDKFELTEEMLYAKECYKNDNIKIDYLQEFIDKTYKIVPFVKKEKIERDNFRSCYNEFLKSKGQSYDTSSNQKFTRLIREKNFGVKESHGKTFYTGLIVNMDDDLILDEE